MDDNDILNRKRIYGVNLQCVNTKEARHLIEEIPASDCETYMNGHLLPKKLQR